MASIIEQLTFLCDSGALGASAPPVVPCARVTDKQKQRAERQFHFIAVLSQLFHSLSLLNRCARQKFVLCHRPPPPAFEPSTRTSTETTARWYRHRISVLSNVAFCLRSPTASCIVYAAQNAAIQRVFRPDSNEVCVFKRETMRHHIKGWCADKHFRIGIRVSKKSKVPPTPRHIRVECYAIAVHI